jgi:LEA14-like dessication related protein
MYVALSSRLVLVSLLLASFSGCYPQLSSLEPPTFELILEGSGLVAFDPPLIGAGETVFRLNLEVTNANTVALFFTDITFALFINDRHAGQGHTAEAVHVPPRVPSVSS